MKDVDGFAGFGIQEQDFPVEAVSEYYRAAVAGGCSKIREPFSACFVQVTDGLYRAVVLCPVKAVVGIIPDLEEVKISVQQAYRCGEGIIEYMAFCLLLQLSFAPMLPVPSVPQSL